MLQVELEMMTRDSQPATEIPGMGSESRIFAATGGASHSQHGYGRWHFAIICTSSPASSLVSLRNKIRRHPYMSRILFLWDAVKLSPFGCQSTGTPSSTFDHA